MYKNSSMPYLECSRPMPECLIPPKGATSEVMATSFTPIMPYSNSSATFQLRFKSCMCRHQCLECTVRYSRVLDAAKGHNSKVMATSFTPIMPYSSSSAPQLLSHLPAGLRSCM